jgi:hypothetical protein
MRRIRRAVLGCLAAAGCSHLDNPAPFAVPPAGPAAAAPLPANLPPSTEAARVNAVGRCILAANPINGLDVRTVRFTTIGAPQAEIFHRGATAELTRWTADVFITDGLAKQCTTDGQLAAVLCLELGKLVSEREAMTPQAVRQPERLPPIDTGLNRDLAYSGVPADQTRARELADYDRDRRRAQQAVAPPDPVALARLYLVRAGYHDADLQSAGPLVQQAQGNSGLEKQLTGR